jgi:hypothetical protein
MRNVSVPRENLQCYMPWSFDHKMYHIFIFLYIYRLSNPHIWCPLENQHQHASHVLYPALLLYTVTDRNIVFSGTLVTCNMLIFGNLVVNPVHFLLTENIKKRDNKGIILWFYYLVQNINVDALMWFFCWINTILMQCL